MSIIKHPKAFWAGVASVFSVLPTSPPPKWERPRRLAQTDAEALAGDWSKVMGDFSKAYRKAAEKLD